VVVGGCSVQRLSLGEGGWADRVLLFTVATVTCPVRVEAGLVLPSVIFLVARDVSGLRQIWLTRRRWLVPFVLGWALGIACSAVVQGHSWEHRLGQFDAIIFLIQMIARVLFLISPDPVGWIPLIYVGLIWYYLYQRRNDRAELAATVLPYLFFSIPYGYSATAITVELPATAQSAGSLFLLLATAKGGIVGERWPAPIRRLRGSEPRRGAGVPHRGIFQPVSARTRTWKSMRSS
jgi:hypothetical protein